MQVLFELNRSAISFFYRFYSTLLFFVHSTIPFRSVASI